MLRRRGAVWADEGARVDGDGADVERGPGGVDVGLGAASQGPKRTSRTARRQASVAGFDEVDVGWDDDGQDGTGNVLTLSCHDGVGIE